jgi:polar amino acid transport system substrate-binding protein
MRVLGAMIVGWCCAGEVQSTEVLRLATGELPPYATQSRADQGIALNIVRAAFRAEGVTVEYHFLPWGRAQEEARLGKWDGTAYWGRKPERERHFLLSDNVITEQWLLLYRAGATLEWSRWEDLGTRSIAAIRTYTYTPEFHALAAAGRLKVDWTPDDLASLRKLVAGRADIVALDRNVACHLLDTQFTPAEAAQVRAHPRLMTENFSTHLMLPRQRPESAQRLVVFNRGLAKLRSSGEYQKLLESSECKAGLARPAPAPAR